MPLSGRKLRAWSVLVIYPVGCSIAMLTTCQRLVQLLQRLGQAKQYFEPDGMFTGRSQLPRRQIIESHGRLLKLQQGLDGYLQFARRIDESVPENPPKPRRRLIAGVAAKVVEIPVRMQKRFLHHIGRIDLISKSPFQSVAQHPGEHQQQGPMPHKHLSEAVSTVRLRFSSHQYLPTRGIHVMPMRILNLDRQTVPVAWGHCRPPRVLAIAPPTERPYTGISLSYYPGRSNGGDFARKIGKYRHKPAEQSARSSGTAGPVGDSRVPWWFTMHARTGAV